MATRKFTGAKWRIRYRRKFYNTRFQSLSTSRRQSNRLTREDVAKCSILQINNTDNLCFPRSLVVARVDQEHGQLRMVELQERWKSMRYQRSSLQRKLAEELTKAAGITISEEDYEICEIEQFQRILASENIAIMIYNFSTFGQGNVRRLRYFPPKIANLCVFKYNVLRRLATL